MTILSPSQIATYAQRTGLTSTQVAIATAIALAESGGDTNAINPGNATDPEYSVGLWQINIRAHPQYTVAQMKDPVQNAFAMFTISNGGTNWNPWGTYTNGSYKSKLGTITSSGGGGSPVNMLTTPTTQFATLSSSVTTNKATLSDIGSGYQYILAYVVAAAIFILMAKTRIGYRALYYGASLLLLLLLVTQSGFIAGALKPITMNDSSQNQNLVTL